jgi:hypothetical protein
MRNKLEMGVDGPSLDEPDDRIRCPQPGAMREVNGYRVSDMANAAVLVLEGSVVPVACGPQCEGHHQDNQKGGNDPAGCPRP